VAFGAYASNATCRYTPPSRVCPPPIAATPHERHLSFRSIQRGHRVHRTTLPRSTSLGVECALHPFGCDERCLCVYFSYCVCRGANAHAVITALHACTEDTTLIICLVSPTLICSAVRVVNVGAARAPLARRAQHVSPQRLESSCLRSLSAPPAPPLSPTLRVVWCARTSTVLCRVLLV
jgi:hypothetical protein